MKKKRNYDKQDKEMNKLWTNWIKSSNKDKNKYRKKDFNLNSKKDNMLNK